MRSSRGDWKISSGWSLLQDLAGVEEADAVGDVAREAHLVRSDEHGHARMGQLADDVQHLGHQDRVERAGDLVEQQQVRLHRQGSHDGHPLLLTTREPVGHGIALLRQAEARQELHRLRLSLGGRQLQHLARGERHVPEDGHVREQVVGLEDDADASADPVQVDAACRDLRPAQEDPAGVDGLQQVDATQQRALARPRRSDEAHHLVLREHEVDAPEDRVGPERLAQALDAQRLHAEGRAPRRAIHGARERAPRPRRSVHCAAAR